MQAQEFLEQIIKINYEFKNKMKEKQQLLEMAGYSSGQGDGERVQSSGSQDRMAQLVAKAVDVELQAIETFLNEQMRIRNDVLQVIEQLPADQYDILHLVYVQDFTLKQAGAMKGISKSWAQEMHNRGRDNVQRILDAREKEGKENERD